MKLVDILARELADWPESWGIFCVAGKFSGSNAAWFCVDSPAYKDGGWNNVGTVEFWLSQEPEDRKEVVVRRFEWQAAIDALNAQKVVEWDGVSLPQKETAVEVRFACEKNGSEWPWHSGVVVASGPQPEGGAMVAVEANGFTVALRVTSDFIRPARTIEQLAAEEREKAWVEHAEKFRLSVGVASALEAKIRGEVSMASFFSGYDAALNRKTKPCGS